MCENKVLHSIRDISSLVRCLLLLHSLRLRFVCLDRARQGSCVAAAQHSADVRHAAERWLAKGRPIHPSVDLEPRASSSEGLGEYACRCKQKALKQSWNDIVRNNVYELSVVNVE